MQLVTLNVSIHIQSYARILKKQRFSSKQIYPISYQKFINSSSRRRRDVVVDLSYPRLLPRCETCEKWGHLSDGCVVNMGR